MNPFRIAAAAASLFILAPGAFAQAKKPKPPAKKPPANQVKGQGQLAGANGQFGVVYSLKIKFNFAVLGAKYTVEPFIGMTNIPLGTDEKMLVVDVAIKNVDKADNFFGTDGLFTAVDSKGNLIDHACIAIQSAGANPTNFTLKPGQGIGQKELNDPLRIAFKVPAASRIVKLIVNQGRLGQSEEVLRYYVAGATKAEAGEDGDPKNVVAPLPENVRDPAGAAGAIALDEGKGTLGAWLPSGQFALRLDSFSFTSEKLLSEEGAGEGRKFAVATITAKLLTLEKEVSFFQVQGGGSDLTELTDSDGERVKPAGYRKAKRDEDADFEFRTGDEYTFRVLFNLPAEATAKKLVIGAYQARKWSFDVSGVK